jgi:hypothetical protein
LIYAGGGWIHPAIVHDGHVVGSWRLKRRGPTTVVELAPFRGARVPGEALAEEVGDVGRFLRLPSEPV